MRVEELGEALLERGAAGWRRAMLPQQAVDRPQRPPPPPEIAEALEVAEVEQMQPIRLLRIAPEPSEVDEFREIEDRAGDGGDRNAVVDRGVPREEAPAVHPGAGAPVDSLPTTRRRHLNRPNPRPREPPERSGGPMAEHGSGSVSEERGEPVSAYEQSRVADGEDFAMNVVQAPTSDPPLHGLLSDPKRPQLRERDDAELALGEMGQPDLLIPAPLFDRPQVGV